MLTKHGLLCVMQDDICLLVSKPKQSAAAQSSMKKVHWVSNPMPEMDGHLT